jgi:hypothetical protein
MRKLFVEELKNVQGGKVDIFGPRPCGYTTQACCEEAPPCQSCCDVA